MTKKIIFEILRYLVIISTSILIGYFLKSNLIKPQVREIVSQEIRVCDFECPECNYGKCPEYFVMDVDEDGLDESVAIVPTAMTQFAGKVVVIDEGKVLFDGKSRMRVDVSQTDEEMEKGNGFTVCYSTKVNVLEGECISYEYQQDTKSFKINEDIN